MQLLISGPWVQVLCWTWSLLKIKKNNKKKNFFLNDTEKKCIGLDSTQSPSILSISQMFRKDMERLKRVLRKIKREKKGWKRGDFEEKFERKWRVTWLLILKSIERLLNTDPKKLMYLNVHGWPTNRLKNPQSLLWCFCKCCFLRKKDSLTVLVKNYWHGQTREAGCVKSSAFLWGVWLSKITSSQNLPKAWISYPWIS